jgi:predicted nicotinamide N-methyase
LNVRPEAIAYVREHFPLTPVPGVPEILVHKAQPTSGLWRLAESEGDAFLEPYWASWWGGGIALARHVLDHPQIVADKRVLDLGAGSGLAGVAAAMRGAGSVVALDLDPYAVAVAQLNAEANGVALSAQLHDLRADDPPDTDVVLAGDVFYDAALAAYSLAYLERCAARGMQVLVGDPGRACLPRQRLRLLAEYDGADFGNLRACVSVFEMI